MFGLDGRYAHALFSAASKKQSLDTVEKELQDFQVCMLCSICGEPWSIHIENNSLCEI